MSGATELAEDVGTVLRATHGSLAGGIIPLLWLYYSACALLVDHARRMR